MRGRAGLKASVATDVGITPAYAGKRMNIPRSCSACGDHPRVCGEEAEAIEIFLAS